MECAEYFRSQAGYRRCFEELLKKWKSYGRPAGWITLADPSQEERRLLGGLLGKSFDGSCIRFPFAQFEKSLQKTRFAPVEIRELLENYFQTELSTNQEQKQRMQQEKEKFFNELLELCSRRTEKTSEAEGTRKSEGEGKRKPEAECQAAFDVVTPDIVSAAACWLRRMTETKSYGYQLLSREFSRNRREAAELAQTVIQAVCELFEDSEECEIRGENERSKVAGEDRKKEAEKLFCGKIRAEENTVLAVFAAEITGNPHAFDRGTTAGQLLTNALCCLLGQESPQNTHQWKELLLLAGIAPDYVSSLVHIYGLHLRTAKGNHPAFEAFRERGESCAVTLENLRTIVGADAPARRVFAVENEMVFSYLTEQLRQKGEFGNTALLCTSGQPRTAGLRLLRLLAEGGCEIFYSGDMDPEGIDIADRLWKQSDGRVRIWRMSPEDYRQGISGESLKAARLARLDRVEHPVLRETARCVRQEKRAAYQENILEKLLEDLS